MPKTLKQEWLIGDLTIPVHVISEWRNSNRIAINRDKIVIRIPSIGSQFNSYESWAKKWIKDQFEKQPSLKKRFQLSSYKTGDTIVLPDKKYFLNIQSEIRKTSTANLVTNDIIQIKLNESLSGLNKNKAIKTLIARIIAQDNLPSVTDRILALNDLYIKENIKKVRIKNNSSNWGSCSSNGNINISVRTLFAPSEVRDYVYIHELAHLKELNHSARFWKIVSGIMPDYKEKERWLHEHGSAYRI